jgi:aminoglycoside phosphotransferase family enzyme/predicted kinase
VRLNRRLAPTVYRGIVPVADTASGLQFEAAGPVVEWAVKMTRMAPEMSLESRLERDEIDPSVLRSLANRLAQFHRDAPSSDEIARQARWDVVADNAMANVAAARAFVGRTLSEQVLERLTARTRQTLDELKPRIERRANAGAPRDTHGDLRVDHVYWLPEKQPPDDWCILDCIEFNERFRYADPVSDVAFLAMDLAFHGRWDLARSFSTEYFRAADDSAGIELLPLYASYRAAVRAKVEGILSDEAEVPDVDRAAALERAKAHWLAALTWLEPSAAQPRIVLIGGLPGSGKTTLARKLAKLTGAALVRSDVVRKGLAGLAEKAPVPAAFGHGLYSDEWNDKMYRELEQLAKDFLWTGGQVIVDASFRRETDRMRFLDLARQCGVPIAFIHCIVPPSVAKSRLRERRGDASDADPLIYDEAAKRWEPISAAVARIMLELPDGDEFQSPQINEIF